MRFARMGGGLAITLIVALALGSVGCNQSDKEAQAKNKEEKVAKGGKTKHDKWWCGEHGVPEHLCSLCSDEVAVKAKKEGNWCKIHDRAQDQCFKCDPEKYKKFEAMYVAKFGEKPVPPPKEEFEK